MPAEMLALQGFPAKDPLLARALQGLSAEDVILGAGNAMSVPVVGAVLADILAKTAVGRLDYALEVSDSEEEVQAFAGSKEAESKLPRFAGCGCWLHLRHLPLGPGRRLGERCLHASTTVAGTGQRLLIGRDPGRTPDGMLAGGSSGGEAPIISRLHAEVLPAGRPGEAILRDLGSTNGSFVLGRGRVCAKDVDGEVLVAGDQVSFGVDPAPWSRPGSAICDFRFLYVVEMPGQQLDIAASAQQDQAPSNSESLEQSPQLPSAAEAIAAALSPS